jgi:competence protein ComGC
MQERIEMSRNDKTGIWVAITVILLLLTLPSLDTTFGSARVDEKEARNEPLLSGRVRTLELRLGKTQFELSALIAMGKAQDAKIESIEKLLNLHGYYLHEVE